MRYTIYEISLEAAKVAQKAALSDQLESIQFLLHSWLDRGKVYENHLMTSPSETEL